MFSAKMATKKIAIAVLRVYKLCISPMLGMRCRFAPTCSEYAQMAIERFGVLTGGWLIIKRILRCHPFCKGGFDPVPDKKRS